MATIRIIFWLATGLLVMCVCVHVAAAVGVDVFTMVPIVWILHLLSMAAFFVAILYVHKAHKAGRDSKKKSQDRLMAATPLPLKVLAGILFAYVFVNAPVASVQMESASPAKLDDGSLVLRNHGRLIRELTEDEYHRYRSYEARAFSGHWMAFSAVAMMLLSGAAALLSGRDCHSLDDSADSDVEPEATAPTIGSKTQPLPRTPVSGSAAIVAAVCGVGLFAMLRTIHPAFQVSASCVLIALGLMHVRRQYGLPPEKQGVAQTYTGCLFVAPCALAAILVTWQLNYIVYIALTCGPSDALSGTVTAVYGPSGIRSLSNGEVINRQSLTIIGFVVWPVGVLLGLFGWVYLADTVGSFLERDMWRKIPGFCSFCGARLRTSEAKPCWSCGRDWHEGSIDQSEQTSG